MSLADYLNENIEIGIRCRFYGNARGHRSEHHEVDRRRSLGSARQARSRASRHIRESGCRER